MKKIFVALILCFHLSICYLQSIAGVQFGMSYDECKVLLDNKFENGNKSYQLEKNELDYYGVYFAGEFFSHAAFYFQNDGKRSYLKNIFFFRHFSLTESNKAKSMRDRLFDLYSNKYDGVDSYIADNDYRAFYWDIKNEDDYSISISIDKDKNNKGEMKLWVMVVYLGKNFIKAEDEI